MKISFRWLLIVTIGLILFQPISVTSQGDTGFIASTFESPTLDLADGVIDDNWSNVTNFQNLPEFGDEGYAKFAANTTHLFSLFAVASTKTWAAIEIFNLPDRATDDSCMVRMDDGWTFYLSDTGLSKYTDTNYKGAGGDAIPNDDAEQDLNVEVVVEGGYHYIEIVRPLNTTDSEDVALVNGTLTYVKFASNTHHIGDGEGGVDNDRSSDLFFLNVQITEGDIVQPDVPKKVDYDSIKLYIIIGVFVSAFGFMSLHFAVRQVVKPLDQCARIIDNDWEPPTLKSRWKEFKEDDQ